MTLPFVYLAIHLVLAQGAAQGLYAFSVGFTVYEHVLLPRTKGLVRAVLWGDAARVGDSGRDYLKIGNEENLDGRLDAFVNDCLAANPK